MTAKPKSFFPSGEINESTRKKIRRKLESEFEDSVHMFVDDKGWLLMVTDSTTLQDIVLENQSLQRVFKILKSKVTNINNITNQASGRIRSIIQEDTKHIPWPYHPFDLISTSIPHQSQTEETGKSLSELRCALP